jgi:hypothetical protein
MGSLQQPARVQYLLKVTGKPRNMPLLNRSTLAAWSNMKIYPQLIFFCNIFLVFIDATIGYYAAPMLARLGTRDEAGIEWAVQGVRKLLVGVVALYMFFNCLAFFNEKPLLLLIVTSVVVLDIVCQLAVSRKLRERE